MDPLMSLSGETRRQRWRDAIAECLNLARAYAEIAEIGATIPDDAALKYGMSNFVASARAASSIYEESEPSREIPKAPT